MASWIVFIYGILVAVGGIMGYVKANSMASLIAGCISGLALAGSAVAMMRGSYQLGWWIALAVAVLLLGHFGMGAISNGFKFMPGGLVIIMSLIVIAVLVAQRSR